MYSRRKFIFERNSWNNIWSQIETFCDMYFLLSILYPEEAHKKIHEETIRSSKEQKHLKMRAKSYKSDTKVLFYLCARFVDPFVNIKILI